MWGPVPPVADPPALFPRELSLRKVFLQTARGLEKIHDFQVCGTDGSAVLRGHLHNMSPLKFRRPLLRDWLLGPPSRSTGSGLFLTVDERLEEVSICGRQRLRPNFKRVTSTRSTRCIQKLPRSPIQIVPNVDLSLRRRGRCNRQQRRHSSLGRL